MIKTAFASSTGRIRETNQDYVDIFKNHKDVIMAVVCDGMGGHQGGDVASTMAVSHLGHSFSKTDFEDPEIAKKWLNVQLKLENEVILETADRFSDLNGMGTTIVVAIAFAEKILIGHLGDSRAYLYGNGQFKQITEDHSLVNELIKIGEITEQQARSHPQKNIITETLGVSNGINPEFNLLEVHAGDIFLLCTDGLTNSLTDPQIQQILATKNLTLKERCNRLINEANRLGGEDNITVCLLAYTEKGEDK
ncbi:Stp1/IreP family PP2C-type Ser/Thr phosphatase [Lactobacillus sp. PV037]|uniref:Stp1/IreP family PP2C-type Ser/Thr phosphatase n=1 Tax=unclassified Lactobacillus TaxID=2620435 RepID=UPI00223E99FA|nr:MULTISPECIES: Stp1/IreP family PP2C-type Ser/Thr phosphatase [unclassified Lactobacillus]QNQ82089.1 Stp1/IreP family PP2C-type Ser/Thr phosphatase [Lactobacillus sp. PV012]QNQ83877.1 Stp1/IreP family PP2C-type Ser/Thr phosphatase [Lactobacillus sp. PV037]